jgi:hypothetical protein
MISTTFSRRVALRTFALGSVATGLSGCGVYSRNEIATALARMARDILPHARVPDSAYGEIVETLLASAPNDQKAVLEEGVRQLDSAGSGRWQERAEPQRLAALRAVQTTPFFTTVRLATLFGLYNNPTIVKTFGYPGASATFGSYPDGVFNDLRWLPEPGR